MIIWLFWPPVVTSVVWDSPYSTWLEIHFMPKYAPLLQKIQTVFTYDCNLVSRFYVDLDSCSRHHMQVGICPFWVDFLLLSDKWHLPRFRTRCWDSVRRVHLLCQYADPWISEWRTIWTANSKKDVTIQNWSIKTKENVWRFDWIRKVGMSEVRKVGIRDQKDASKGTGMTKTPYFIRSVGNEETS